MANFTVEKAQLQPSPIEHYIISYTKVVKDVNGKDVTIPDRTENVTLEALQAQVDSYQAQIAEIQAKIEAIKAL